MHTFRTARAIECSLDLFPQLSQVGCASKRTPRALPTTASELRRESLRLRVKNRTVRDGRLARRHKFRSLLRIRRVRLRLVDEPSLSLCFRHARKTTGVND